MTVALMPMSGHKNGDFDEISLTSYQTMVPHMPSMISFHHTEPSDLLPGSTWGMTTEGSQPFQDYTDNGSCHSGEAEDYIVASGHTTPRGTKLDRCQTTESAAWAASGLASTSVPTGARAMSRVNSCRSNGSSLSRSSQLSNMDMRGNAAFRNGSQSSQTMVGADCLLVENDAAALQQNSVYWSGYSLNTGLSADCTAFSISDASPLHVVPSQMQFGPDTGLPENSSPGSWASFSSSISRTSSPATMDDAWFQNTHGLTPNSSPEIPCQSPLLDIKDNLLGDDMTAVSITTLGDGLCLPATFPRRDGETARSHDLYKNASPGEDGLYHCPWEGESCCNHRAEKLKCNYDKFVDSHLKPYRCKAEACEGARFSSTACLLRHEREAHGLHGHGDKPFLCHYDGCERGVPGNGFPRQWNLKDHMKRVHNDPGSSGGSPPAAPAATQPSKGRKRKSDSSDSNTSRKSSHKTVAPKDTKVAAKPLLDQWVDHRHAVEELLRNLNKPEDVKNLQQISEMKKLLDAMTQMTSALNPALSAEVQLATHVPFAGTG